MTNTELRDKSCALNKRFSDILYAMPGKSTDGIPNLSDIKAANLNKNGEKFDNSFTYSAGDMVSFSGILYISNADNNTGNIPFDNSTFWTEVKTGTIEIGSIYTAAFGMLIMNSKYGDSLDSNAGEDLSYIYYNGGYGIERVEYNKSQREISVFFSPELNFRDNKYQVLTNSRTWINSYSVVFKATDHFKIKFLDTKWQDNSLNSFEYLYFSIIPYQGV